jgi:hypothetical protein
MPAGMAAHVRLTARRPRARPSSPATPQQHGPHWHCTKQAGRQKQAPPTNLLVSHSATHIPRSSTKISAPRLPPARRGQAASSRAAPLPCPQPLTQTPRFGRPPQGHSPKKSPLLDRTEQRITWHPPFRFSSRPRACSTATAHPASSASRTGGSSSPPPTTRPLVGSWPPRRAPPTKTTTAGPWRRPTASWPRSPTYTRSSTARTTGASFSRSSPSSARCSARWPPRLGSSTHRRSRPSSSSSRSTSPLCGTSRRSPASSASTRCRPSCSTCCSSFPTCSRSRSRPPVGLGSRSSRAWRARSSSSCSSPWCTAVAPACSGRHHVCPLSQMQRSAR